MSGYVYLLHFSAPISPAHTCQHYVGFTTDLPQRIQLHRIGKAARLTEVAHSRGISFVVARVWRGDRYLERAIKNAKHTPRLCPVCSGKTRGHYAEELTASELAEALIAF